MDTGRLATMLSIFVAELQGIRERLQPLRMSLKDEEKLKEVPKLRTHVEDQLKRAPSLQFVPSWIRMIRRLGGRKLHASEIQRRLDDILGNSDYELFRQGILVEQIEGEVQDLHNHLRNLLSALNTVGVRPEPLPVGVAEIGVLFPPDMFGDLEEFVRETAIFDRHIRTISELIGRGSNPKLAKLQTNGFDVFLWSDLVTGAKFVAVIFGILRAWREIEETRKVRAEASKLVAEEHKLAAEATEILERLEKQRHIAAKEAIVKDLTATLPADEGRAKELENAARRVVEYVEQRIAINVTFEVRSSGPSVADEGGAADEKTDQAIALIRESGHVMAQFEIQAPVALLAEGSADDPMR